MNKQHCTVDNNDLAPLIDSHDLLERNKKEQSGHHKHPPPLRIWDNSLYHNIPGVPQPSLSLPTPVRDPTPAQNVFIHPGGAIPKVWESRRAPRHLHHEDRGNYMNNHDDDYSDAGTRKDRRLQKLQEDGPLESLKGAPEPDVLFLYITGCDTDTTAKQIEHVILREFSNVSQARVRETKRNHDFYA